ncbi:MAG TPA: hypothetical protein VMI72_19215 [Roseiarcus sp.]|nr:hypothetical protein [Roseiarcus sp.]
MRVNKAMIGIFAAVTAVSAASAAEMPARKAKPPEAVRKCNVGGVAGVLAANNVCVRASGYVSVGFRAGQIK